MTLFYTFLSILVVLNFEIMRTSSQGGVLYGPAFIMLTRSSETDYNLQLKSILWPPDCTLSLKGLNVVIRLGI